ncbi:MAG: class I SAM-dependent methyltransferase [Anaerolineales bacterium]|uniref:Class I SAM-dependent methyltransferase n=1 Tax=Candidatus Desulfolinea nitratireducens TaxID=2841698 RepID=A0A8J6TEE2_9CHLR|nr:class I SAM-dependent methyltransferase [Candidatus Desulfolinea nitratireducens]MBL6960766.1 class I SAM-dependent methyltransferase [Anaerolineales bacterium]
MEDGEFLMQRSDFKNYKEKFVSATKKVLKTEHSENLDEAAFPAYSNPNLLMSFLFWERLYRVIQYVEKRGNLNAALDFGCGSGVMLPFLSQHATKVIAVDIDLEPLRRLEKYIAFDKKVQFLESFTDIPRQSLDLIIALDVLEHVDDLEKVLAQLSSLLTPSGEIIISGPTESILYKLGRFIAGPTYSGDYHVRNIYDIQDITDKYLNVRKLATLFYPIPLFLIFTGRAD